MNDDDLKHVSVPKADDPNNVKAGKTIRDVGKVAKAAGDKYAANPEANPVYRVGAKVGGEVADKVAGKIADKVEGGPDNHVSMPKASPQAQQDTNELNVNGDPHSARNEADRDTAQYAKDNNGARLGSMDDVHIPKANNPFVQDPHAARDAADDATKQYADDNKDKDDSDDDQNNDDQDDQNHDTDDQDKDDQNDQDKSNGDESDDNKEGSDESSDDHIKLNTDQDDPTGGKDLDDGETKIGAKGPAEPAENSKTLDEAGDNPIKKAAGNLGDDEGAATSTGAEAAEGAEGSTGMEVAKAGADSAGGSTKKSLIVEGAKAGLIEGGKLAALYAAGKLFDKAMEMLGLGINGASAAVQSAIVNSPVGQALNGIHAAAQNVGNFIHGIGNGIGNAAHAIGHGIGQIGHGIAQAGHGIANAAGHVASGIAHVTNNAINSVASVFTGHTVQAATISTATVVHAGQGLCATAAIMGVGYGLTFFNSGQRDYTQPPACQTLVDNAETGAGKVNANQTEEKNAKMAYSLFKTYGMSDAAVAGILGNWTVESHIDPTILEGFSGIEMYHIGPRKKAALAHLSSYAKKCAAAAGGNYSGYGKCPGLGLGQWTSDRGLALMAFAKKMGGDHHWYDMDVQLAWVLAEPQSSHGRLNLKKYGKHTDVDDATRDWFLNWEGIDNGTLPQRQAAAHAWIKKMKGWKVNNTEANNILSMAKKMGSKATEVAVNDAANNCARSIQGVDNSSLIWAALSFAWDSNKLATGNNGTPLYQKVHKGIFPGDPHFQSCDRVVASAVRWSGTDIKYPAGSTSEQYKHDMTDSHWKKVGTSNSMHYSELKPGDIFLANGVHTFLYVGNPAVKESIKRNMHSKDKTPANGDEVDGSLNQRSAGIGVDAKYSIQHGDGNTYTIFRNKKNDKSKKYASVAKMPSKADD